MAEIDDLSWALLDTRDVTGGGGGVHDGDNDVGDDVSCLTDDLEKLIDEEFADPDGGQDGHGHSSSSGSNVGRVTLFPSALNRNLGKLPFQQGPWPSNLWVKAENTPVLQLRMNSEPGFGIRVVATAFAPPMRAEQFVWGAPEGTDLGEARLEGGSYAVVRCADEQYFRGLLTLPAKFGEAGGHAGLASEGPVVFAGELKISDAGMLLAWSLISGTYQIPHEFASQSALPMDLYWRYVSQEGYQALT